jgi:uncharacterized protein YidB (DUF937 family)
MLDQLMDLVRNQAGNAVINNPKIPNEKNDDAVQTGTNSIVATLQSALAGGRLNDVLDFFKSRGSNDHSLVNEATSNYSRELQGKFGMNANEATDTASKVIPSAMGQLASRAADPNDNGFNIQDIFNQLSGGKTSGFDIQNLLSRFGAGKLDRDNDGDVDLKDLAAMFGGGGAGGVIGGLFK